MYEMWISQKSEAAPGTRQLQPPLAAAQPGEPAGSEEYRERICALEEELAAMRREQSSVQRSFFEAAQIQRRLCAPRQLHASGFDLAGEIFPVRHLSGDFFKVFELGSDLGIVVGDIAGKGLSAGIWMPHLVSLVHCCAKTCASPGEALAAANRELCSGCGEPPLAAVFLARLEGKTGEIAYCNAGLPAPLVFGRDNGVRYLEAGGPMLGASVAATFATGIATMENGDSLFACSDGVTECENSREQEFAMAGLLRAARAFAGSGASQTLFATLGAVLDFADGQALRDDLTLLVARREAATILH